MADRHTYYAAALADAVSRGLTPAQVARAGFHAVAIASGLDPSAPPADFRYINIKRRVALELQRQAADATAETRRSAIRTKVRELIDLADVTVSRVGVGDVVDSPGWIVRKA